MNNIIDIPVLWVDDKPKSISAAGRSFAKPSTSASSNVSYRITPEVFTNWEEAEKRLTQPNDFIAIILDGMCNIGSKNAPNINKFIPHVHKRLGKLGLSKLPVFIYSAQGDKPLLAEMELDEEDPDFQWKHEHSQAYYRKGIDTDIKALKDNIIAYAQSQTIFKLKYAIYRDLFLAVRELKLNDEVEHNMISLLAPLHFDTPNVKEYISKASCVRTTVEHLFRSMYENGMLPKGYVNSESKNRVNITACFRHLCDFYLPNLTKDISIAAKSLISLFLHTSPEDNENFRSYSVNNQSSFLLRSVVYWLCDLIMWYVSHLRGHSEEDNRNVWEHELENKNLTGTEGILRWRTKPDNSGVWEVMHGTDIIPIDREEPGRNKPHQYIDGMECNFLIKETKTNKKYALAIDPLP